MDTNDWYTRLAPLLLALFALEAIIARLLGKRAFVLADTLSNLSCGLGQILLGIFTGGFLLGLYDAFGGRFALMHWPIRSPITWVVAFVLTDLCYYAFHRSSHRVTLLWAIHAVHHQSEEFNLSVALRQTWFSDFTGLVFYWPLPLFGVPREAFFVAVACLSVYQVMQHTGVVRGVGLYGLVFNTPETHSLHHARNTRYLDRNFGSTLIVWDRLFGTFARRTEDPVYGLAEPYRSYNPVSAQLAPALALTRRLLAIPRLRDRLLALLMPPEWLAPGEPAVPASTSIAPRWAFDARPDLSLSIHATTQFCAAGVIGLVAITRAEANGLLASGLAAAWVVWATANVTGLLESRPWAVGSECARLLVLAFVGAILRSAGAPFFALALVGLSTLALSRRLGARRRAESQRSP